MSPELQKMQSAALTVLTLFASVCFTLTACEDAAVTEISDVLETFVGTCNLSETPCNGACTNVLMDTAHCGACGRACADGDVCNFGVCRGCAAHESACDGACFDTSRSDLHCGACDQACTSPQTCIEGLCLVLCEDGLSNCGTECLDLQTDHANCGACGQVCGSGTTCCGGACVDPTVSQLHCGVCDNRCLPVGERCISSTCEPVCGDIRCAPGQVCCDKTCVSPEADENHCGGCFISCEAPGQCASGLCPEGIDPVFPPANAYAGESGTWLYELHIPDIDEATQIPECCKDFGERSRDFILGGTHFNDNALSQLADGLKELVDFQDIVDAEVASDRLNILFDHRGLDNTTADDFVLAQLLGKRAVDSTLEDAIAGQGEFHVASGSYDERGVPRVVFNPATVTNDVVSVRPGTLQIVIPLGIIALPFTLREATISGDIVTASPGVEYARGELSGVLSVQDFFDSINAYTATFCDCLGLTTPLYEINASGQVIPHCVAAAANKCGENSNCATVGGNNIVELQVCSLLVQLITEAADIDTDGDTSTFEALSLSFEFKGAGALITPVP